jgi:hypothetical protein
MGLSITKTIGITSIILLVLSIIIAIASIYPVTTNFTQSKIIINDTFSLSQNQIRRQGLGAFQGGENITVLVESPKIFAKNFSITTYSGLRYQNNSSHNLNYTFTGGADYYEAILYSETEQTMFINFQVSVEQIQVLYPFAWLAHYVKLLFIFSVGLSSITLLRLTLLASKSPVKRPLPFISQGSCQRISIFVIASLIFWLVLLAFNTNPLGTFENWYTDHVRHAYSASLFLKDGLSVFSEPLNVLSSKDNSTFKFVTWPEMPHLYPIGSILVFLPFGALLQYGINPNLIYKLEITLFLIFAHVCLYFFLKIFLKKNLNISWKLLGIYIIYVTLIVYAANGMFDSIAFLFSLFAVTMFLINRYDAFFFLVAISFLFKYQAGIFLMPLIIIGILNLIKEKNFKELIQNKGVVGGAIFGLISVSTAYLSMPYLIQTRPQFIMNGINAFSPNAQIPWSTQSFFVLLTLVATLIYVYYMYNRNSILSLAALFILLASFSLPYFQNWYLPFIFIYALIPQSKRDNEATMLWLIFMMAALSFGNSAFNPITIIDNFRTTFRI